MIEIASSKWKKLSVEKNNNVLCCTTPFLCPNMFLIKAKTMTRRNGFGRKLGKLFFYIRVDVRIAFNFSYMNKC